MSNDSTKQGAPLTAAIRAFCDRKLGVIDSSFLCQSIGLLNPKDPICVKSDESLEQVLATLRANRIGCVLVVDQAGKLSGIFSERDVTLKVAGLIHDLSAVPISKVMTPDPVAESPETTVAYALNLMSQGGFRHIPIVDSERTPVGIISVKDVVDHIVGTFMNDLLSFDTGKGVI